MALSLARMDGTRLQISDGVLAVFGAYLQDESGHPEAGGIMLGRLIRDGGDVVLDEATTPSPSDRRTRFRFFRKRKPAQQRVNKAWGESVGTKVYLGEWHTHPEDHPTPSDADFSNWRRIMREVRRDHNELFFVIVGRFETRVWEGQSGSTTFTQLHPIT